MRRPPGPPAARLAGAAALLAVAVLVVAAVAARAEDAPARVDPVTVHVFFDDAIHFDPEHPDRYAVAPVTASDNGRAIERTVKLDPPPGRYRIWARVTTKPIPQDVKTVADKWDRAGNVQLVLPGQPPIEVVRFMTAYGGRTEHRMDVTRLAPLLRGKCTFRGLIDTWVTPAWKMDFELTFEPESDEPMPDWMKEWVDEKDLVPPSWVRSVLYEPDMTAAMMAKGDRVVDVDIPEGTTRVMLRYLSSGHCTDGTDADEFVTKDNVVTVDGKEVWRHRPWRQDCRDFRDVNPYCRRWFDGSWSADFSRSGWCPGDAVAPEEVDLTGSLPPGPHKMGFRVEDIRPKDDSGQGYWRVSACLVGWQ